jgi:hypothetical protein
LAKNDFIASLFWSSPIHSSARLFRSPLETRNILKGRIPSGWPRSRRSSFMKGSKRVRMAAAHPFLLMGLGQTRLTVVTKSRSDLIDRFVRFRSAPDPHRAHL